MSPTSTVCQGLHPCLDPLLLKSRVLIHQLVPSKQGLSELNPQKSPIDKTLESNGNGEGLFMQSSTTNPSYNSTSEPEKVNVHPLSKCSSSSLSLETCTESLGSETGDNIDLNIDELTCQISYNGIKEPKKGGNIKKVRQRSSFPPPLTSIRESEGVGIESHRQGGRLVIKAFTFSSSCSCFRVERKNGRLRLSLMNDGGNEEEGEQENVGKAQDDCDEGVDDKGENEGCFWEENIGCKIGGGGEWCTRTAGAMGIRSLQCCVAIT